MLLEPNVLGSVGGFHFAAAFKCCSCCQVLVFVSSQLWVLVCVFYVLVHCGPQQGLGRWMRARRAGLGPHWFVDDRSGAVLLFCFIPIVVVFCRLVQDSLVTIYWERAVLLVFHLMPSVVFVFVSRFGVLGRMLNSIVSVPDHCIFIFFRYLEKVSRTLR